jgi:acyl dehydratase
MVIDPRNARVGDQLPLLKSPPVSRAQIALYAGASGDHNPVHIDTDFARAAGLEDVFAHGMLSMAQLGRLVTNWAGIERVRSFSARFTAITHVHDQITCSGEVVERFEAQGEARLRIALRAHVESGVQTLAGEATISAA